MIAAKVTAFAKLILRGIALLIVLLILIYAGFKIWAYYALESNRTQHAALQRHQKTKYDDLTKDQSSYAPLMMGTPSYNYVMDGNRNFIFTYLLSADYKVFQEAMEDSVQMVYVGKQILGSGCKKQACNELGAAFVIDPETSQYFAAISQNGKIVYYGVEHGKLIPPAFMKWQPNVVIEEGK